MKFKEFKIWFDGFCEAIDNEPTTKHLEILNHKVHAMVERELQAHKLEKNKDEIPTYVSPSYSTNSYPHLPEPAPKIKLRS